MKNWGILQKRILSSLFLAPLTASPPKQCTMLDVRMRIFCQKIEGAWKDRVECYGERERGGCGLCASLPALPNEYRPPPFGSFHKSLPSNALHPHQRRPTRVHSKGALLWCLSGGRFGARRASCVRPERVARAHRQWGISRGVGRNIPHAISRHHCIMQRHCRMQHAISRVIAAGCATLAKLPLQTAIVRFRVAVSRYHLWAVPWCSLPHLVLGWNPGIRGSVARGVLSSIGSDSDRSDGTRTREDGR